MKRNISFSCFLQRITGKTQVMTGFS